MRHHNKLGTLGRERNQRNALLKMLAKSLVTHGKITTTEARARELRPFIEKLITKSKAGDLSARRLVGSRLGSMETAKVLITITSEKFMKRAGGYTRIVKLPRRMSDGAYMAHIELLE